MAPSEVVQQYVRSAMMSDPLAAGVEVVPSVRVIGIDEDSVYFQNSGSAARSELASRTTRGQCSR